METSYIAIFVTLCASLANALGAFFFKRSSQKISLSIRGLFLNGALIGGILLYGLSALLAGPAFRYGQLSVLYPLMATAYIWTTLFGWKYMGEKITSPKLVGITFIIIGVLFIGLGK